jgi:hypothetical protein
MFWFNQAMWFPVNNLERFLDSAYCKSLIAKFETSIKWLNKAARPAIRAHIIFMVTRHMMEEATLQATIDPNGKLLAAYYEALGARQVEGLIKIAQFSLNMAPSPNPTTNKQRKFNVSGKTAPHGYVQPQMRNAYIGCSGSSHAPTHKGAHDVDNCRITESKRIQDYKPHPNQAQDQSLVPKVQRGMLEEMAVIESTSPTTGTILHVSAPSTSGSSSIIIKLWYPIKVCVLD